MFVNGECQNALFMGNKLDKAFENKYKYIRRYFGLKNTEYENYLNL